MTSDSLCHNPQCVTAFCGGCGEADTEAYDHHRGTFVAPPGGASGGEGAKPKPKADLDSVLREADGLINGHRQQDYGTPLQSFTRIAAMWSAYLDVTVSPDDVAMLMALLKVCRAKQGFHRDSLVDLAGYAGCVELMKREREEGP